MKEEYIIGTRRAPEWCRRFLQPYMKPDGSTGYHYYGKRKDAELSVGDKLVRENGKITIVRKEGER